MHLEEGDEDEEVDDLSICSLPFYIDLLLLPEEDEAPL